MVPSIDSYLYKEISSRLSVILKNCYIIDEVLRDMDKLARERFKNTFCGENPTHEIDVSYAFPTSKEQVRGRYVIQLGDGSEEIKSLGGVEGTYDNREQDYREELTVAKREDDKLYFEVSDNIGIFGNMSSLSFAESDEVFIKGNRLYFNYDEALEGFTTTMFYTGTTDTDTKENFGTVKGFTARENVTIVGISTNVDTARCLDLIMKVILITMRDNMQEQSYYGLQTITFGVMTEIESNLDLGIFGRPANVSFLVSYGVDLDFNFKLNELLMKERGK